MQLSLQHWQWANHLCSHELEARSMDRAGIVVGMVMIQPRYLNHISSITEAYYGTSSLPLLPILDLN